MLPFGLWVHLKRVELGLSIGDCCERCGLQQPNWSRMEKKTNAVPRRKTVEAVAVGLGLPLADCLKAAGYDAFDESPFDMQIAHRLSPHLMRLPPERRPNALNALEQMAKALVD